MLDHVSNIENVKWRLASLKVSKAQGSVETDSRKIETEADMEGARKGEWIRVGEGGETEGGKGSETGGAKGEKWVKDKGQNNMNTIIKHDGWPFQSFFHLSSCVSLPFCLNPSFSFNRK